MREVFIVETVRTAVGKRKGGLATIRPDNMVAKTISELVKKSGVEPSQIDDVILGCVHQVEEQAINIARSAALIAGLPLEVPGTTLDRQCGSGQQAVHFAAQAILSGDMDMVIAGGVESMSRVPFGSTRKESDWSEELTSKYEIIHQGISAERIADQWGISRQELDEYSYFC